MINHRGGILIFGLNFDFSEIESLTKFEILNPSQNLNFESLTLNPKSRFWQNLDLSSI